MSALAFCVGVATGLGAVLFRDLIGFIHNAAFLGLLDYRYDSSLPRRAPRAVAGNMYTMKLVRRGHPIRRHCTPT